jgi:glycosyltransferase involved in cell wall biosynthesis
MARVLFIAYYFPPLGGPGTQRSAKFVRDLTALGHEVVVVTGPGVSTGRWDPPDATLGGDVPAGLRVHRVEGSVPGDRGRAGRWLDRPSPFSTWWVAGVTRVGRSLARDADVICASMAPYETAEAAGRVSAEARVPWVADLRDPWALDEMRVSPTRLHRRRDVARMRRSLATAATVVMNTPEAAAVTRAAFPRLGAPVVSIPNGWDARDFAGAAPPAGERGPLRIVHTGSLHTELGLRQSGSGRLVRLLRGQEPVDILARSHVHLMDALRTVRAQDADAEIELHLAGTLTDADLEVAAAPGVEIHGYLDHDASVALVRSADLLFLPMHDLPAGRRARLVPGKTYEYLASGRRLLAAVPDGDARDLVSRYPDADVCRPTDVPAMAAAIRDAAAVKAAQGRLPDAPRPGLEAYERSRLAQELSDVLEACAAGAGRGQVAVESSA